jgi:hypothetical protein
MLVMAGAGLDATLKRLIKDALPKLVDRDVDARTALEKFAESKLRGAGDDPSDQGPPKFLAPVLTARSPRDKVIELYIEALVGQSLQSKDQVYKVAAALGLDPKKLGVEPRDLTHIFDVRNSIIHEMDADPEGQRRKRVPRRLTHMREWSATLLGVAHSILLAVNAKI